MTINNLFKMRDFALKELQSLDSCIGAQINILDAVITIQVIQTIDDYTIILVIDQL